MRVNEARVAMFLYNTERRFHYASEISSKLRIDYCYLLKTLKNMQKKGWIIPHRRGHKIFYILNDVKVVDEAKASLTKYQT